ncbi:MAG: hypothetical protein HPY84_03085 [Syntrophobacteraceae bacterium]|nr:hypothetical protein [Syntrophobacteraceae bacterium]
MKVVAPVRVERTYTQRLCARPDVVFPLLCPVRETEWVEGWDPLVVITATGKAELDCVFLTGQDDAESIWVITGYDPDRYRLVITRYTPGMTVARITISLTENADQSTDAAVTYMYTAVSEEGKEFVENYSEEYFVEFMKHWENALNRFLSEDGEARREEPPHE